MGDGTPSRRGRVVRNAAALWRRTLEGVVVLAAGSDEVELLAPPADEIWSALARPVDIDELAAALASDHAASADVVLADVERFVEQLVVRGLVVEVEPSD
jgi:hypothetical protein